MVRSYRFLFLSLVLVSLIFSLFFCIFLFHSVSSSLHVVPSCHRRRIEKRRKSCRSHQKVRLQLSLSLSSFSHQTHIHREKESSIDRFFFPRFFSLSPTDVVVCVSHSSLFFSYSSLSRRHFPSGRKNGGGADSSSHFSLSPVSNVEE